MPQTGYDDKQNPQQLDPSKVYIEDSVEVQKRTKGMSMGMHTTTDSPIDRKNIGTTRVHHNNTTQTANDDNTECRTPEYDTPNNIVTNNKPQSQTIEIATKYSDRQEARRTNQTNDGPEMRIRSSVRYGKNDQCPNVDNSKATIDIEHSHNTNNCSTRLTRRSDTTTTKPIPKSSLTNTSPKPTIVVTPQTGHDDKQKPQQFDPPKVFTENRAKIQKRKKGISMSTHIATGNPFDGKNIGTTRVHHDNTTPTAHDDYNERRKPEYEQPNNIVTNNKPQSRPLEIATKYSDRKEERTTHQSNKGLETNSSSDRSGANVKTANSQKYAVRGTKESFRGKNTYSNTYVRTNNSTRNKQPPVKKIKMSKSNQNNRTYERKNDITQYYKKSLRTKGRQDKNSTKITDRKKLENGYTMTNVPESGLLLKPGGENITMYSKNSVQKIGTQIKRSRKGKEEKTEIYRHPRIDTKRNTVRTSSTDDILQHYKTSICDKIQNKNNIPATGKDQTKKGRQQTKIPDNITNPSSGNEKNQSEMETGIMKYLVRIWTKIKSK